MSSLPPLRDGGHGEGAPEPAEDPSRLPGTLDPGRPEDPEDRQQDEDSAEPVGGGRQR